MCSLNYNFMFEFIWLFSQHNFFLWVFYIYFIFLIAPIPGDNEIADL